MRGCFEGGRAHSAHCNDVIIFVVVVVDKSGGFIRHRVQETRQRRKEGRR